MERGTRIGRTAWERIAAAWLGLVGSSATQAGPAHVANDGAESDVFARREPDMQDMGDDALGSFGREARRRPFEPDDFIDDADPSGATRGDVNHDPLARSEPMFPAKFGEHPLGDMAGGAQPHSRRGADDDLPLLLRREADAVASAETSAFEAETQSESRGIARRFASAFQSGTKAAALPAQSPGRSPAQSQAGAEVGSRRRATSASKPAKFPAYRPPSLNLLQRLVDQKPGLELSQTVLRGNARLLEDVLADFGIKGEVRDIRPGPVITLYELEIARGIKASRVIGLAEDIARSMSAPSARISVIPGSNTLGIELPNLKRVTVSFRDILESESYKGQSHELPLALGKSIDGSPMVVDLARMPHLLVAGTTGSGKSVGVNAMILSLLYRHGPERLRLLMIDPKMLELSIYNGIPHLLTPVVTDPQKAVAALNWAIREMEDRYKRMAEVGVRNIGVYNTRMANAAKRGATLNERIQTGFDAETGEAIYEQRAMDLTLLPHIVIVVDEFADLMIVAGKDVEAAIQRLAQMARAAGIHLIMATQRPSVDVVTGTIKANFPTRIGFKVASKVDSRTILNEQGAEQLLGQGDMLMSNGSGRLDRIHGAFISDEEVETIAAFLRSQAGPGYVDDVTVEPNAPDPGPDGSAGTLAEGEDLYDKAVAVVIRDQKATTSYLQRRLSIGYNRAASLIERMEQEGLIGPPISASGKREIFALTGSGGG